MFSWNLSDKYKVNTLIVSCIRWLTICGRMGSLLLQHMIIQHLDLYLIIKILLNKIFLFIKKKKKKASVGTRQSRRTEKSWVCVFGFLQRSKEQWFLELRLVPFTSEAQLQKSFGFSKNLLLLLFLPCYPSHGPFSIQQNTVFKRQVFCVSGIMQDIKLIISLYSYN